MILVTGATGTIGSLTVGQLARAGHEVRALGRDTERLRALSGREGVEAVVGDFEDADSIGRAVDGADAVLAIAPAGTRLAHHDATLVAAAVSAGVKRMVKISSIATDRADWPGPPWHRAGEEAVRQLAEWTVLRPSTFSSNTLGWADAVRAGEPVPNPFGEGRQGVIDPRDIAAVAADALTRPGHTGQIHTLTGPALLSVPEQAAVLSDVLGREVTTTAVPIEAMGAKLREAGAAEEYVVRAEHGARLVLRGDNAVVTSDVAELLGRPAATFADWARDHRAAFS